MVASAMRRGEKVLSADGSWCRQLAVMRGTLQAASGAHQASRLCRQLLVLHHSRRGKQGEKGDTLRA